MARFESALFPGYRMVKKCLMRFSNVHEFHTLDDRLEIAIGYRDILLLSNFFGKSEEWQDFHFTFSDMELALRIFFLLQSDDLLGDAIPSPRNIRGGMRSAEISGSNSSFGRD